MVKLDKIYTRGGDTGSSGLGDGNRRSKADLRFVAIGAVDEANCAIGVARTQTGGETTVALRRIQNDLFDLGAELSFPDYPPGGLVITPAQVARLEAEIDTMNMVLAPLTSFILPGGVTLAALLHQARAITRRAEREMAALAAAERVDAPALAYINRLSDHLFVMARMANDGGKADVLWVPGGNSKLI